MDDVIDTIVIDALVPERRVSFLCRSRVIDIRIYRPDGGVQAGDIILGRVRAVVHAVHGAFIEIGDRRDGFLSFPEKATRPPVQEGDAVIVQVRHEAMAEKGARLTSRISLAGRYAVYTPDQPGINVSRKGNDPDMADQAVASATAVMEPGDGAIVRTAALQMGEDGLRRAVEELASLRDAWLNARAERSLIEPPHCLIGAPDPVLQALQGANARHLRRIVVEGADAFALVRQYLTESDPHLLPYLEQYKGLEGVFASEGVEAEIEAALSPDVPLPSGGYLHIHQTPACVTVDVDTAGAVAGGGRNSRDLIRRTNEEAVDALARALRLRNLSGNIVVDFIHDGDKVAGRALLNRLTAACLNDPVPVEIAGFTRLGLVELTRRRRSASLQDMLSENGGAALNSSVTVKSAQTLAYEALRRLLHAAKAAPGQPLTVRASPEVIWQLQDRLNPALRDTKTRVGVPVSLVPDESAQHGLVDVYNT